MIVMVARLTPHARCSDEVKIQIALHNNAMREAAPDTE
jgi:hypothetical protein